MGDFKSIDERNRTSTRNDIDLSCVFRLKHIKFPGTLSMPRFFLNVREGDELIYDPKGATIFLSRKRRRKPC
jgi:hypothetical protein